MGERDERPTEGTPDVELELDESSLGDLNDEEFDLSDLTDDDSDRIGAQPTPSKPAEAPAASPAAPAPTGTEASPAKTAEPAAAEPAGTEQPFTYQADRQSYTIDGAKLTPTGDLMIPAAQLPEVTRLLRQGRTHEGSFRQTLQRATERATAAERALEQAKTEPNEEVVKARAINKFWTELLEKGPDAVAEHLDEFQRTRDKIEARIDREMAEALRKAGPVAAAAAAQPAEEAPTAEKLKPELEAFVNDFRKTVPELGVLTDDDAKGLLEHLGQDAMLERLFFIADEDLPAQGILKGDIVCDTQVLKSEMGRIAKIRAEAAAAAQANGRNQPRLAGRQQGLPPVVTPTGSVPREDAGQKGKKTFKSKAEFDEYYANLPIEDVLRR